MRVASTYLRPSHHRATVSFFSTSVVSSFDSLLAYGAHILRCIDPHEKVALTFECQNRWNSDTLPIYSESKWGAQIPPTLPARGPKPELLSPKEMPSMKQLQTRASIPVIMLHALAHIELGAIDNYWDTIVRFDPTTHQLSRDFYNDFLKIAADEARHFTMVNDRLRQLGSEYGALPATKALLLHASNTAADLSARIAVLPLVQEARGLDSGNRLVRRIRSMGDKDSARVVKQIVWEERDHVRCGIKWFKHIAKVQKRENDHVTYFQELVLQFFPDGLPGPFDVEARLAGDMGTEWYQALESKVAHACPPQISVVRAKSEKEKSQENNTRVTAFAASKKKVIVTGLVWPERTSSAAGVRSADIISVLQERDFQVFCVSPSRLNDHTARLEEEQEVTCMQADANTDAFKKLLLETMPQLVIFDRFIAEEMYGWQAKKYAPDALRVMDLQDLHFVRRARELAVTKLGKTLEDTLDGAQLDITPVEKLAIRELASIHRSDLTLYVSDFEHNLLVSRFQVPEAGLHRCEFFYPPIEKKLRAFSDRKGIAFIGSFKHAPNVDAVEWTKKVILPMYRSIGGDAEVHVYGSHGETKRFAKLDDPKHGIFMKGFTPDAHEMLSQYRLSIAPLRFGAGIKGKIADSWFVGTPCVSTSIGAEGMISETMPWGGSIANNPRAFASEMLQLYNDESRWSCAQDAGVAACSTRYDWSRNADSLMVRVERALREKQALREQNWMGRILWSEKFRATEYMSKYIRMKNEGGVASKSNE